VQYCMTDAIITLRAWYIMLPTFKEQLTEADRMKIPYQPLVESNKKTASSYQFPHRYKASTLAARENLENAKKDLLCMNCFATDHLVSLPCPNPFNKEGLDKWNKEHPGYLKTQRVRRNVMKKKKRLLRTETRRLMAESAAEEFRKRQELLETVTSVGKGGVIRNAPRRVYSSTNDRHIGKR